MFLLIQYWSYIEKHHVFLFTFQYVSINTGTTTREEFKLSVFTFQYVSINTKKIFENDVVRILFTFQYVSINTSCDPGIYAESI